MYSCYLRSTYMYLQLSKNYTSVTYLHLNHHREHTPGIPGFHHLNCVRFSSILFMRMWVLWLFTHVIQLTTHVVIIWGFLYKKSIHCLKQNLHAGAESSLDVMLRSFFMEKWFNLRPFVLLRRESKLIEDLHHRKHKYENTHQNYTSNILKIHSFSDALSTII